MLDAYGRWGVGPEPEGEWSEIRQRHRATFHRALREADEAALARIFTSPGAGPAYAGLVSPHVIAGERHDRSIWHRLTGNRLTGCGRSSVPTDFYRHDTEAMRLAAAGTTRIVEIGGGYGGMARQLLVRNPQVAYVDIDLPDTLYLAYAYLTARLPDGLVRLGHDPGASLALVPPHEVPADLAPEIVVAFRVFGEIGPVEREAYFTFIRRWRPRYVLYEVPTCQPWAREYAGSTAEAWPEALAHEMPCLDGYLQALGEPSVWAAGAGRYWRYVFVRADA